MKKHIASAFAIAGLIAAASAAHAADGVISVKGSIIANTCTINGGGAGDFTVNMPAVSASALQASGATAGRTPFQIELSGCSSDQKVQTMFEAGPSVNTTTGRLLVDTGAGAATKVELGLLNDSFGKIRAGAAADAQNSQQVQIAGGNATMNYYVQYESLGGTTAGAANSSVQYTLVYQ